ncbi:OmpA family protein [Nocardiopsis baichengensis]|uniref:OmpA family protein n=1 Tax=Nocardiopsis baichengensis TaxID=280240 RepID=UPI00034CAE80|nr:OmpA family protein [Nocardiopsis baichengensis]
MPRPIPRLLPLVSTLSAGVLMVGGCGLFGGEGGAEGGPQGTGSEGAGEDDGFVREGYAGSWDKYLRARVEVKEVARLDDRTRLTVEYTNVEDREITDGSATNPMDPRWFRILDPVGQVRYAPYEEIGPDLEDFDRDQLWNPGVTYEMAVYLPPLEGDPERVTVEAPGGIGEFAGVPVTEGEPEEYPSALPEDAGDGWPAEGNHVTVPVTEGAPSPDDGAADKILSPVETVVSDRERDSEEETVALRADVLFAFDEAELTENARSILKDVIEETRERADPEKPPITVTGHTDGIGDDDYNDKLSEERAEAVRAVLEEELGADYVYETEGMGSSDPVEREGGDDDAWARAQNRRVEISYAFKEEAASESREEAGTEKEMLEIDPADAGGPAGFRDASDEEPAAEVTAEEEYRFNGDRRHDWTMRVYPFYRDGAFLVGRIETTHEGDELPSTRNPFGGSQRFSFTAMDPQTGTVYPTVRRDTSLSTNHGVSSVEWPPAVAPGSTQYAYFYLTAPPEDVTELTLNAGIFGQVTGVPIDE